MPVKRGIGVCGALRYGAPLPIRGNDGVALRQARATYTEMTGHETSKRVYTELGATAEK